MKQANESQLEKAYDDLKIVFDMQAEVIRDAGLNHLVEAKLKAYIKSKAEDYMRRGSAPVDLSNESF